MSTWERLCRLSVEIDGYELSGHASDWRLTTVIRMTGAGHEGLGEDPNYDPGEQRAFQQAGATLPLSGRRTLGELSDLFDSLPVSPVPSAHPGSEDYRRWGFESAALDLALRQADTSLADRLELTPRPLTFVVSMHLDSADKMQRIRQLLTTHPELGLKLDATASWTEELIEELAGTGAVRVVDFKGAYHGTPSTSPRRGTLPPRTAEPSRRGVDRGSPRRARDRCAATAAS